MRQHGQLARGAAEVADPALDDALRDAEQGRDQGVGVHADGAEVRADFFQYLRERAGEPDAIRPHLGTIGVHADTLVAALLGVAEGVVEGRVGDLGSASRELAVLTHEPLRRLMA